MPAVLTPEDRARIKIDQQLEAAGWRVQTYGPHDLINYSAVAIREFPLSTGRADYLLVVNKKAIGVVEAKAVGITLSGITHQSHNYSQGISGRIKAWNNPLRFLYQSTGVETIFRDEADPEPRSRGVFTFHRPETLEAWAKQSSTLRGRLRKLPDVPLPTERLWEPQQRAIRGLEFSLAQDKPYALIQMATGSGKTYTAISEIYRLIKYGDARRILFLVDRSNLGLQAYKEFQAFEAPNDGRKFTELYNVQHLTTNQPNDTNTVVISTLQRLYSILKGEPDLDPSLEEKPLEEQAQQLGNTPLPVVYSDRIPIEYFDFIFIDECHRSIYNLWKQVLEYFDAYLIGLTATPSTHTYAFFKQNLVMEYTRQQAVADGINVDCKVYRIRTKITREGAIIDPDETGYKQVRVRDRRTRELRWKELDEELIYTGDQLDQEVMNESQIRKVIQTFRDRLFLEIFPGREIVPKTLIFAKDDSHAEEIQRIVKEEFGKGDDFCQKITYRVSGVDPQQLIQDFRTDPRFRIAVTVDMVAAGTDIKPIEVVMFMRLVKSASLFEQMIGRGTRIIDVNTLQGVTWDAEVKDHFVIVDTVGVVEHPKLDTKALDQQPSVSLKALLTQVANGLDDEALLLTLVSRLTRLQRRAIAQDQAAIMNATGGMSLAEIIHQLLAANEPDRHLAVAQAETGQQEPSSEAIATAAEGLREQAAAILGGNAALRQLLLDIQQRNEQVMDEVNLDELIEAGFDQKATDYVQTMVQSFKQFIEEKRDELDALQIIYSMPALSLRDRTDSRLAEPRAAYRTGPRLTFQHLEALQAEIVRTHPNWTTEALWNAYTQLRHGKKASGKRRLTDLITLIRAVVQLEDELVPYPDLVQQRYQDWLAMQEAAGHTFTPEQRRWLDKIAEQVGVNLSFTLRDFNAYFHSQGGLNAARRLFGKESLPGLLAELNESLGT